MAEKIVFGVGTVAMTAGVMVGGFVGVDVLGLGPFGALVGAAGGGLGAGAAAAGITRTVIAVISSAAHEVMGPRYERTQQQAPDRTQQRTAPTREQSVTRPDAINPMDRAAAAQTESRMREAEVIGHPSPSPAVAEDGPSTGHSADATVRKGEIQMKLVKAILDTALGSSINVNPVDISLAAEQAIARYQKVCALNEQKPVEAAIARAPAMG